MSVGSKKLRVEALEDRRMLAVYVVDTKLDSLDPNDGVISLREAVAASNTRQGEDSIRFSPMLAGETIRLTMGQMTISDELSIIGPGAKLLTIDASGSDPTPGTNNGDGSRIFFIGDNNSNTWHQVTIEGITLTGGDVSGNGGAIWAEEQASEEFASGTMVFDDQLLTATGQVTLSIAQRESTGILTLTNGAVQVTTTFNGDASGAHGATGSGVDVVITESNDDSGTISLAIYDAQFNEMRITADLNSNGSGISALTIQDLSDAIGGIETFPGTPDFTIGAVTQGAGFLTAADAGTAANVLTGGMAASFSERITITAVPGAEGNMSISFIEQAGIGATPVVWGNATDGFTIAIDLGNTESTIASIASAVQSIAEVATATTASTRSFNGSLDNAPAAITNVTGGRDAGTDVITVTAAQDGPAFNRNLVFNTSTTSGGIAVWDDGSTVGVLTDGTSQYHLDAVAQAITDQLADYNAVYTGDGSGTYEADNPNDNTTPVLTNLSVQLEGVVFVKPLALNGVLLSDNHANGSGGGIYSLGAVELTDSTIARNAASGLGPLHVRGGGLFTANYFEATNSTLSGNQAVGLGASGGAVFSAGPVRISQSTITANLVSGSLAAGGGVASSGEPVSLQGTVVAGNFSTASGDDLAAATIWADYSLLGSADGLTLTGTNIQVGVDPLLTSLSDYGGSTPTHSLLPRSPAIDAGDPTLEAGFATTRAFDQRGGDETEFVRVVGDRIDIGAVEYQNIPAVAEGDFNANGAVDGNDFLAWQRNYGTLYDAADLVGWQDGYGGAMPLAAVAEQAVGAAEPIPDTTSNETVSLPVLPVVDLAFDSEQESTSTSETVAPPIIQPAIVHPNGWNIQQRGEYRTTVPEVVALENARSNSAVETAWLSQELLERVFG